MVCAPFLPLIHGLCAFFRLLLTPLSTAPSRPPSQFTVYTSWFARLQFEVEIPPDIYRSASWGFPEKSAPASAFGVLFGDSQKVPRAVLARVPGNWECPRECSRECFPSFLNKESTLRSTPWGTPNFRALSGALPGALSPKSSPKVLAGALSGNPHKALL